jgi:hypothetical protein
MQRISWLSVPLAVVGLTVSTASLAQNDRIELFTDQEMTTCGLVHDGPAIRSIYMFHTGSALVTASEFSVPKPACWTGATYVGETIADGLLSIGNSQTDLSIAYGTCALPPVYLGRIDYAVAGTAPSCCMISAAPAQTSPPGIWVVDCSFQQRFGAPGAQVTVNPTAACPCDVPPPPPPPPAPSRIELFTDDGMAGCGLLDDVPAVRSVYMFHTGAGQATGSEFSAPKPDCWTGATYLADVISPGVLTIGNSQTDLSVAYLGCQNLPVYIGRIDYTTTGVAPECCRYAISQAPLATPPGIWIVDCNFEEQSVPSAGGVTIHPTSACPCDLSPPLRVENTTWGRIKSMYHGK